VKASRVRAAGGEIAKDPAGIFVVAGVAVVVFAAVEGEPPLRSWRGGMAFRSGDHSSDDWISSVEKLTESGKGWVREVRGPRGGRGVSVGGDGVGGVSVLLRPPFLPKTGSLLLRVQRPASAQTPR
jgi:hypothetical protein